MQRLHRCPVRRKCETNLCQGDEQEYQPVLVIYHCGSNAVIGLVDTTVRQTSSETVPWLLASCPSDLLRSSLAHTGG